MDLTTPSATLWHFDLRLGWRGTVRRDHSSSFTPNVQTAIVRSHVEKAYVPVERTPFELVVFLGNEADGNAGVWLATRDAMANGQIAPHTPLYSATVAVREATAPLAWRCINNQYLNHMLGTPPERFFNAPGLMPRTLPWLCGFLEAEACKLSKDEQGAVLHIVRLAGVDLIARCERAVSCVEARGTPLVPNPEQYIELKSWE